MLMTTVLAVLLGQNYYCPAINAPSEQSCTSVDDPVDLAYGNYTLERHDALIRGSVSDLEFIRYFSSMPDWGYWRDTQLISVMNMPKPFGEPAGRKGMYWWHNWFSFIEHNTKTVDPIYLRQMGGRMTHWTNTCHRGFLGFDNGASENLRVRCPAANGSYQVIDRSGQILQYSTVYHPSAQPDGGSSVIYFLSSINDENGVPRVELHYGQPTDSSGQPLTNCFRDDPNTWAPYLTEVVDTRSQSRLEFKYAYFPRGGTCYINIVRSGAIAFKQYAPSVDAAWSTSGKLGEVWSFDGAYGATQIDEVYIYADAPDGGGPHFKIHQADAQPHLEMTKANSTYETVTRVKSVDVQDIEYDFGHNSNVTPYAKHFSGQADVFGSYKTVSADTIHSNRLNTIIGSGGGYPPGYFEVDGGVTSDWTNNDRNRKLVSSTGSVSETTLDGTWGARPAAVMRGSSGTSVPWPDAGGGCTGLECEFTTYALSDAGVPHVASQFERSVIQSGTWVETRKTYHANGLLQSSIRRGVTLDHDGVELTKYVATFYRLQRTSGGNCLGGSEPDKIAEVEGPCFVDNFDATQCSTREGPTRGKLVQSVYQSSDGRGRLSSSLEFPNGCGGDPLETIYSDYTVGGKPREVKDPNGVLTTFEYTNDGRELLTAMRPTGGGVGWSYTYDKFGSLVEVNGPDNTQVEYCYYGDGSQPPPAKCDAVGVHHEHPVWVARYPYQGNVWLTARVDDWKNDRLVASRWYGAGPTLEYEEVFTFDGRLRSAGVTRGTAPGSAQHKNADGLVDLLGRAENAPPPYCMTTGGPAPECDTLSYDTALRLTHLAQTAGGTAPNPNTFFEYDQVGNPCRVTLNHGSVPAAGCDLMWPESDGYQFDDFGNLVRVSLLNTGDTGWKGVEIRQFDAAGNVTWQQTPPQFVLSVSGAASHYEYDYDYSGRVTRKSEWQLQPAGLGGGFVLAETSLYTYEYDTASSFPVPGCPVVGVRTKGRLAAVQSPLGKTFYDYDEEGRLIVESLVRADATDCSPEWYTQTGAWYSVGTGRLNTLRARDRRVEYIYKQEDGNDRVSAVQVWMSSGNGEGYLQEIIRDVKWTARGDIKEYSIFLSDLNQWRRVVYTWETDGTLSSVVIPDFFEQHYLENLLTPARNHRPREVLTDYKRGKPPLRQFYSYDSLNRITNYSRTQLSVGSLQDDVDWEWDERGNAISMRYGGAAATVVPQSPGYVHKPDVVDEEDVSSGSLLTASYTTDEGGRVVQMHWPTDSSGLENGLSFGYAASAIGDTAIRLVQSNSFVYTYAYDEKQRRRVKVSPLGDETAFTYALADSTKLLLDSDERWKDGYHADDFYIWLGGMPVAVLRGLVDDKGQRLADTETDCWRDDRVDPAGCGVRYVVSDYSPKPILAVDTALNVVGVGEYAPFGEMNTIPIYQQTTSPYPMNDSEVLAQFSMPNMGLVSDWMFNFTVMDTETNSDFVKLLDMDTHGTLASVSGYHLGRGHGDTSWHYLSAQTENYAVTFVSKGNNCAPGVACSSGNNWDYTGAAVESMEYQRRDAKVMPYFVPLRFPGQYHDEETGLNENWNRFFLPGRRYLQPEPLLQSPMYVQQMTEAAMSVPAYSYAANNPVQFSDRTGLCLEDACLLEGALVYAIYEALVGTAIFGAGAWCIGTSCLDPAQPQPAAQAKPIAEPMPNVCEMGQGERGRTAKPTGTLNPWKHCRPHPTDAGKIVCKDQNGKWITKPKPAGFDAWWNSK